MSFVPNLDLLASYARNFQQASCTITEETPGEFDPNTGEYGDPSTVDIYTGSCLVQPTPGARVVEFGEGPTSLRTYEVHLNGQVSSVKVGHKVSVSGSRDDQLDAAELVVIDVEKSSTFTNRRVIVEEQLVT
jgi:hypothetical protein